eukprot:7295084-Pyramimonas_sp.AAC.1
MGQSVRRQSMRMRKKRRRRRSRKRREGKRRKQRRRRSGNEPSRECAPPDLSNRTKFRIERPAVR